MVDPHLSAPARTRDFPLTHPDVEKLKRQFTNLKRGAKDEANQGLARFKSRYASTRFLPSRLQRSRTAQDLLAYHFAEFYYPAIVKRLPQLRRLNLTIWKICPEWEWLTDEDMIKLSDITLMTVRTNGHAS